MVALQIAKLDAGVAVLLTADKRLIEFPSILLPPNLTCGSVVDIAVSRNAESEAAAARSFAALQDRILQSFGASEPTTPILRCRNTTQTSVVLEWDPIHLATAELLGLSLYRNGQKAGAIPRPLTMQTTKISGLAVDTEYAFHLVLRTTAGTYISEKVPVRTHKMTDLSGVTVTMGIMPGTTRDALVKIVGRIGAKIADEVRIDTTHLVTTEGRGLAWERAVEMNIPVVRPEWLDACERSGRILGVTKFYLDAVRPPGSSGGALGSFGEAAAAAAATTPPLATNASTTSSTALKDLPERPKDEEPRNSRDKRHCQSPERQEHDEHRQRSEETERNGSSPAAGNGSDPPQSNCHKGTSDGGGQDSEDKGKALASLDGASFQDVAL